MHAVNRFIGTVILAFSLHSLDAQAAIETWRMTAVFDHPSPSDFVGPAFTNPGQTVIVDYAIDTSAPSSGDSFYGAVSSMTFNGETSSADPGYIINVDGLHAINVGTNRTDGIDFVSFNSFQAGVAPDVSSALAGFASAVNQKTNWVQIRFDFGNLGSVYAIPTSFTPVPVPEPGTYAMVLIGLGGAVCVARRRRSAS